MYVSCSPVTIQQGSSPGRKEFLYTLPEILVEGVGNGCSAPADYIILLKWCFRISGHPREYNCWEGVSA